MVDTFGTGTICDEEILEIIRNNFSFEVKDIIDELSFAVNQSTKKHLVMDILEEKNLAGKKLKI